MRKSEKVWKKLVNIRKSTYLCTQIKLKLTMRNLDIRKINDLFNEQLQQQIVGTLITF